MSLSWWEELFDPLLTLKSFHRNTTTTSGFPKPYQNLFCRWINPVHHEDLMVPFFNVSLIDANSVNPEHAGWLSISQMLEGNAQIVGDHRTRPIDENGLGSFWRPPRIRQCLELWAITKLICLEMAMKLIHSYAGLKNQYPYFTRLLIQWRIGSNMLPSSMTLLACYFHQLITYTFLYTREHSTNLFYAERLIEDHRPYALNLPSLSAAAFAFATV
jgi:hypothetical protein